MTLERISPVRETSEKTNRVILALNNLSVSKGDKEILIGVNLTVTQGEHAALVGPNGVGKTTLLEVITGDEQIFNGSVLVSRGLRIAYVPQSIENIFPRELDHTVLEYLLHAKGLDTIQTRMQEIEEMFTHGNTNTSTLLHEYGELQTRYQTTGGYSIESDAKTVMEGIGLADEINLETPIKKLSGGEKTKLFLAQALMSDADLLLLDEPSNHLDSESITWLGNYLLNYRGAMIVISHELEFLSGIANKVIEISSEDRGAYVYTGGFDNYLDQKEKNRLERERKSKRINTEVAKLKEIADRLRAGDRSKTSKDRQRKLERIESERPGKTKKEKVMQTAFEIATQSGKVVLTTTQLVKKYDTKTLDYSNISLNITRGEKVAITGPVGAGKSTLLKIIAGIVHPDSGACKTGYKVNIGYYSQEMEDLDINRTILQELRSVSVGITDQQIRTLLGSFLFSGDEVFKLIGVLSYGERSRVMLAKLAVQKYNFLVLDEPSNHLDAQSKKALSKELHEYEGTLLLVSHDEEFMNGVGLNKIIMLPEGKTQLL